MTTFQLTSVVDSLASEREKIAAISTRVEEIELMEVGKAKHEAFVHLIEDMLGCDTIRRTNRLLSVFLVKLEEYRTNVAAEPDLGWADAVEDEIDGLIWYNKN